MKAKQRIHWALWSLRVATVFYYLMILGCIAGALWLPADNGEDWSPSLLIFLAIFTLPFALFFEIVIAHLKKRKFWAWVAGIVISGFFVISIFFPFGIFILIGLLSKGSREEFMVAKETGQRDRGTESI